MANEDVVVPHEAVPERVAVRADDDDRNDQNNACLSQAHPGVDSMVQAPEMPCVIRPVTVLSSRLTFL